MPATRRMRSVPAMEVPPNFITIRATSQGSHYLKQNYVPEDLPDTDGAL